MQRLFPIHSESENNRLTPESKVRKNSWVFHKFWTRIGVFTCPRAPAGHNPSGWEDWLAHRGPSSVSPHGQASSEMLWYNFAGKMHHGVDRDMQTSDSSGPVRTGQLSCISSRTRSKWWEPASQSLWHSAFAEMLRWGKKIAAAADGREDRDWLPK